MKEENIRIYELRMRCLELVVKTSFGSFDQDIERAEQFFEWVTSVPNVPNEPISKISIHE